LTIPFLGYKYCYETIKITKPLFNHIIDEKLTQETELDRHAMPDSTNNNNKRV